MFSTSFGFINKKATPSFINSLGITIILIPALTSSSVAILCKSSTVNLSIAQKFKFYVSFSKIVSSILIARTQTSVHRYQQLASAIKQAARRPYPCFALRSRNTAYNIMFAPLHYLYFLLVYQVGIPTSIGYYKSVGSFHHHKLNLLVYLYHYGK
ncbi:MAG: hypothetical protein ACK5YV_04425 [Betaproteobacteria bacterium]